MLKDLSLARGSGMSISVLSLPEPHQGVAGWSTSPPPCYSFRIIPMLSFMTPPIAHPIIAATAPVIGPATRP